MTTLAIDIPIRTVSEANRREHWAAKAKRVRSQRKAAKIITRSAIAEPMITITLTRVGPRKLDTDNLAGALKAVQDGIADAIGIDDGSELIRWQYRQRSDGPKQYAVEVKISNGKAGA